MTRRDTDERPPIAEVLLGFVREVDAEVERWNLERAYWVAGGPFLTVAHRLGWPAADRALSFVLAVRRLACMNRPPEGCVERRDRGKAEAHYIGQRDALIAWLTSEGR